MIDLTNMSIEELDALIKEATERREKLVEARKAELLAELEALGGAPVVTRKRKKAKPKYRSKKNPELTWTGRGATPRWLVAEMKETGLSKEDFLI